MSIINNYDLAGEFIFGNEIFTSCYVNSSGYIFFGKTNISSTYNPFMDPRRKTIAPFSGNTLIGPNGISTNVNDNIFTVVFNCYSHKSIKTNILTYSVLLYLNSHQTRPNQIDFIYMSSSNQSDGFQDNYYIGYCDGDTQKYISDVNSLVINYGGSKVVPSAGCMFPANNTSIINITNIVPACVLPNAINCILYNVDIGGTFSFGSKLFDSCNISSNGYIFFDGFDGITNIGPSNITSNPFTNSTWKVLAPFCGNLVTTNDGITIKLSNDIFVVTFNCYSKTTTSTNILIFEIILYLSTHNARPNEVDFVYKSSISRNANFFGNYFIGCCDGIRQRTISDPNVLVFLYGSTCVSSDTNNNVFPQNGTILKNITNIIPNNSIYLQSRFSALARDVSIGGSFCINGISFTTCTISTNGFIYFGCKACPVNTTTDNKKKQKVEPVRAPNEDTSNPFKIIDWIIFAPFCGKLKTTLSGIVVSPNISDNTCTITFNCYTTQTSNTSTIIFAAKFYYSTHPKTPNYVVFSYLYNDVQFYKQNYYVGYSNGYYQKYLLYNTDNDLSDCINSSPSCIVSTNPFPTNALVINCN